ncbi:hypothetical protein ATC03_02075 [Agromyces aureus]|uniref:Uncharacterized protein n=1 Tax=Agromyces aureus TaxID=453304 RepID=A0A191WBU6_9MICO|nr:hypothetical protein ATC03_02075 [Agromyces aureus]
MDERYTAGDSVDADGTRYHIYRVLPGQSHMHFPRVVEDLTEDEATHLWLRLGQSLGRAEAFTDAAREELLRFEATE